MMRTQYPLSTSHTRRVRSSLPLSRRRLSGVKAMLYTGAVCPCSTARELPGSASHSRIVWSKPALAIVRPSGLHARHCTRSVCPSRGWRQRPLSTSQTLTVRSQLELASRLPSVAKASPCTQLLCPESVCTQVAGGGAWSSQICIRPSKEQLARSVLSELQATANSVPLTLKVS